MRSGAVAQLGERRLCKPEVSGSIPLSSNLAKCVGSFVWSVRTSDELVQTDEAEASTGSLKTE